MTKLVLAIDDYFATPLHFYHGDHLGSAAYLTDRDGHVVQTLSYLPYGEDWVEQNGLGDTSRLGMYRYNGKERDGESQLLPDMLFSLA